MRTKTYVCPPGHSWALDNSFRRLIHNPDSIFKDLIKPGFSIIDLGCGPGTFTIDLAEYAGPEGSVLAVDLQKEMLDTLKNKAANYGMADRIICHQCSKNSLNLIEQADFILAFYMVHEVPDQKRFYTEVTENLKPDGTFLIVEPKFHLSKKGFLESLKTAENCGLEIIEKRKIRFSRSCLMGKK
jgi:ubiquinone/menaquinone biosynthesis C-methylase UbiE